MRILINSFRRFTNLFGFQFLSLKNYEKLLTYQTAMEQLGVRYSNLEQFINVDLNDNILVQTEKFAEFSNSSDSYFKKLNQTLKQTKAVSSNGEGNSIEDTYMAQYNEGRIARMLLQEKLNTLELRKPSKTKTVKRAKTRARAPS